MAEPQPGPAATTLQRLRARPFVGVAAGVLAALAALAIYAPLIASDRPYYIEAIDLTEYRNARGLLPLVARNLAARVGEQPPDLDGARSELAALENAAGAMTRHLAAHGELDELLGAARAAVERAGAGRADEARRSAAQLEPLAQRAAAASEPGAQAAHLIGAASWPLFDSLSALEVFAMALLPLLCLAAPWRARPLRLWPGRARALRPRPPAVRSASALVVALACALLWAGAGARDTRHGAPWKAGIASGDIVVLRAVFPPVPMGYAETDLAASWSPPSWAGGPPARDRFARHWLGTDAVGRDLLARLLWGGRVSLAVGALAGLLATVLGVALGAAAGWFGGRIDASIARTIEVVQCFPALFLVLLAISFAEPAGASAVLAVVVVIALFGWTHIARLVRAEFLRLRGEEFVQAAVALGFTPRRTIFVHVLPNALAPAIVAAVFAAAAAIVVESTLSFLGFGIQAPVPSWGALLSEAQSAGHWWIVAFPGACIFLTVLCLQRLGEALRECLDPRTPA